MKVKIKSVSDSQIWYSDLLGFEFDVFELEGAYYFIPIPFEYLKIFMPYLLILKMDCEIIENG